MFIIDFKVSGQSLERVTNIKPVKGSKDYVCCRFDFSDDWDDFKAVAVFSVGRKSKTVMITHGECKIPDEFTDNSTIKIELFGKNLRTKITTNKTLIEQA